MTAIPQSITKAQFSAMIGMGGCSPSSQNFPFTVPLNFSSVSNLQVFNGNYTPHDDYLYLLQGIPLVKALNFFMLLCDSPISLTCSFTKNSASYAVNRFCFMSWVLDPANWMTGMFIDGRINPNPGVTPMTQNQLCNYTLIVGEATLS